MGSYRSSYDVQILKNAKLLVATYQRYQEIKKPHLLSGCFILAFELGKLVGKREMDEHRKIDLRELIDEIE